MRTLIVLGTVFIGMTPLVPAAGGNERVAPEAATLVAEMQRSFDALTDYQCRIDARIVNGRERMHIKGRFAFRKPRQVLLTMGVRGGVVFRKDGRIRGWFLTRRFAHDHHPDDRVLRDVRGRRIDQFVLGDLVAELGTLLQRDGSAAVVRDDPSGAQHLLLEVVPGGTQAGFSRRLYRIDRDRTLPVRFQTFDGGSIVEDIRCDGIEVDVGLEQRLFE